MHMRHPNPELERANAGWRALDAALLRGWPLPAIAEDADKEARGLVLVIAGSREIPGAALLAGTAALRAGAGKLVIATAKSVAVQVALSVPEARVTGLPETATGAFTPESVDLVAEIAKRAGAALVGPGMVDNAGTAAFVAALLPLLRDVPLVLDAGAIAVASQVRRFDQPVVLTPHAGEMAGLLGISRKEVEDRPQEVALRAAAQFNAAIALKGATTWLVDPQGPRWRHDGALPGLATSGSGDVLGGLVAGIAAQGAPLVQAAAWGIVLHALAGAELAQRLGAMGFLARELAGEVPALLQNLQVRA
jgi:ADP-dependent NAD(P)H-hydrate dehydratase